MNAIKTNIKNISVELGNIETFLNKILIYEYPVYGYGLGKFDCSTNELKSKTLIVTENNEYYEFETITAEIDDNVIKSVNSIIEKCMHEIGHDIVVSSSYKGEIESNTIEVSYDKNGKYRIESSLRVEGNFKLKKKIFSFFSKKPYYLQIEFNVVRKINGIFAI